jgi:hypothetical protein
LDAPLASASATTSGIEVDANPMPSTTQVAAAPEDEQLFCPTCGSLIDQSKYDEIERTGTQRLTVRRPSPQRHPDGSLLEGLGSGRVDPFLSYPEDKPTPKLHELMDHGTYDPLY